MYRKAAVAVGLSLAMAGGLATTAGGQGDRVTVNMTEFEFGAPDSFPKGRTTVVFRNRGRFPHNFTVVAAYGGAKKFKSRTLDGGKRQRRTIRLRPGVYLAVCTVNNGGHLAQGMEKRFTVGTFNAEEGSWE